MAEGKYTNRQALMLVGVFLATFMDGLDSSIVTIALPSIATDFGTDVAAVSWVSVSYLLVLASTLIVFARLAADSGVRRIMLIGLAIFTGASVMCGISSSLTMLLVARVIQGVGAAMIGAAGPICCTEYLPRQALGTGMAVLTAGSALGYAFGPSLGGLMLEYMSWNWIFLINLLPGVLGIVIVFGSVPTTHFCHGFNLDWLGAVTLGVAIAAMTFAVEKVTSATTTVLAVASILAVGALCVFVWQEQRTAAPLLNLSIFRRRGFAAVFLALMLMNMAYLGILYLLPFFGEVYMELPSGEVGLIMMISAGTTALFSLPIARWSNHKGRRPFCVVAGLLLICSVTLLLVFAPAMTVPILALAMLFKGLGWAFTGGPMGSNLVEHAEEDRDMASSLMNEAYYIGGVLGTAVIAVVFALASSSVGVDIRTVAPDAFLVGFTAGTLLIMALGAAVSLLSLIVKDQMPQTKL